MKAGDEQVTKAKRKNTGEIYALKIMNKKHIIRENKVKFVKMERMILDQLDHPGVVKLCFTFQDVHSLCNDHSRKLFCVWSSAPLWIIVRASDLSWVPVRHFQYWRRQTFVLAHMSNLSIMSLLLISLIDGHARHGAWMLHWWRTFRADKKGT